MIRALFFDLDGTLLDTIHDIQRAINQALKDCGYSYSFDHEGTKRLIGNGADMLIKRALKEKGGDVDAFSELKKAYMPYYKLWQNDHTAPFEGLKDVLIKLKEEGILLFVVTNKPAHLAPIVVKEHYGDLFTEILGQKDGIPVKPDPYYVNYLLEKYHLHKEETLFVGDSLPDVETGHNAGVKTVLCKWGYGFYDAELLGKSDFVAETPKALQELLARL